MKKITPEQREKNNKFKNQQRLNILTTMLNDLNTIAEQMGVLVPSENMSDQIFQKVFIEEHTRLEKRIKLLTTKV